MDDKILNNIKLKNIYDGIISQLNFKKYVIDKEPAENINYNLLETIYGGFVLTLISDTYFTKDTSDNYISDIHPKGLEQIALKIAKKNINGYSIGNLNFQILNLFKHIRNKTAHNDFIIENNKIKTIESKIEGEFSVEDFWSFVATLEDSVEGITMTLPYTKNLYPVDGLWQEEKIKNGSCFNRFCDHLYQVKIEEKPLNDIQRDVQYYQNRDYLIEKIDEYAKKRLLNEETCRKLEERCTQLGMDVKLTLTKVKDLKCYDEVKKRYVSNSNFGQMEYESQKNVIGVLFDVECKKIEQKFNLRKGLELAALILTELNKHPEYDMKQIKNELKEIETTLVPHRSDICLSICLANFIAIYELGLESHFYQQNKTNFISICEGLSLDFSKLNLDEMKSPIMHMEKNIGDILDTIDEYDKKQKQTLEAAVQSAKNAMSGCFKGTNSTQSEKMKKVKNFLFQMQEVFKHQDKIKRIKDLAIDFDADKYDENLNIIFHIRNAIAHGNVFLEESRTNFLESIIRFEDYSEGHTGNLVYQKTIKLKDFLKIFNDENIKVILDYVVNSIEDKTLIDLSYYENMLNQENNKRYIKK